MKFLLFLILMVLCGIGGCMACSCLAPLMLLGM